MKQRVLTVAAAIAAAAYCLLAISCAAPGPGDPGASDDVVLSVDRTGSGTVGAGAGGAVGGTGSLHMVPGRILGVVPDFTLTGSDGSPFGLRDLRGQVWIVDLIFTSCAGPCPMMTARMGGLQTTLEDLEEVSLVSITVDPLRDTPEVLADYAQRAGAKPGRWSFLTGPGDAIASLARNGLVLGAMVSGEKNEDAELTPFDVGHSQRFVLVDGDGGIRGYYDSFEPADLDLLARDARVLVAGNRMPR